MAGVPQSNTTIKHQSFISEPIGDKNVFALPGIGKVYGENLEAAGFKRAYAVVGQFLILEKSEVRFKEWLNETCGADARNQQSCYMALKDWTQQHM